MSDLNSLYLSRLITDEDVKRNLAIVIPSIFKQKELATMITLPRILKESISALELCKAFFPSHGRHPDVYHTSTRSSKLWFEPRYKLHALDSILPTILPLESPPFIHLRRISLSMSDWCFWIPRFELTESMKGVSDSGKIAKLLSAISKHNHRVGQSTIAPCGLAVLETDVAELREKYMDVLAELGCGLWHIWNASAHFFSAWDFMIPVGESNAAWNIHRFLLHRHLQTASNQPRLELILKFQLCINLKASLRGEQVGKDSLKDVARTLVECASTDWYGMADDPDDEQSCDFYRIHIPAQIDFTKNILTTEWEGVQYNFDQVVSASDIVP